MVNSTEVAHSENKEYMRRLLRGETTLNPARLLLVATEAITNKISKMAGTIFRRKSAR